MAGKRIGLFGGTFNPIHLGHLRGAEDIRESFGLDRVVFLPAAIPPHKLRDDVIEPRSRLEMVKLATLANPFFSVSDVEIERSGKSYSIDTLRYFRERQPDSFFFILGMDAFVEIETWKEYQKLFSLCSFIVMARPGSGKTPPSSQLPDVLVSSFHYDQEGRYWLHESGHTLHFKEITFLDISSTRIRELVEKGKSLKYLVPPDVEAYIRTHGLYQSEKRTGEEKFQYERFLSFFICHLCFFWYNTTLKIVDQEDMTTDAKTKAFLIIEAALNKKALNLTLLEMKGITSFTDYFFICSGTSDRQVQAISEGIQEVLEGKGARPLGLEGTLEGKWILMDYEDVVVHVFLEPVRQFYDLEGLWVDAPRINLVKGANIGEERIESEKGSR